MYDDFNFEEKVNFLVQPVDNLVDDCSITKSMGEKLKEKGFYFFWQLTEVSKETLLSINRLGRASLFRINRTLSNGLLDKTKKRTMFFDKYPNGVIFTDEELKILNRKSEKPGESQGLFLLKKTLHLATLFSL